MIAPAFLNLLTTPASRGTTEPRRLKEPAVVFRPCSDVSMHTCGNIRKMTDLPKLPSRCYLSEESGCRAEDLVFLEPSVPDPALVLVQGQRD